MASTVKLASLFWLVFRRARASRGMEFWIFSRLFSLLRPPPTRQMRLYVAFQGKLRFPCARFFETGAVSAAEATPPSKSKILPPPLASQGRHPLRHASRATSPEGEATLTHPPCSKYNIMQILAGFIQKYS